MKVQCLLQKFTSCCIARDPRMLHIKMFISRAVIRHCAIYCHDSFVLMLCYCPNLKAIRYESTSTNRIVADNSHHVIVA